MPPKGPSSAGVNRRARMALVPDDDEGESPTSSLNQVGEDSEEGSGSDFDDDEAESGSGSQLGDDDEEYDSDASDRDQDAGRKGDAESEHDSDSENSDDDASSKHRPSKGRSRSKKRGASSDPKKSKSSKTTEITVERAVIHEALLRRAIHKDLKTYYVSSVIPDEDNIDLSSRKINKLTLSFCNLKKISNLHTFVNLKELRLDNNSIERIDGLEALTSLTWLDLSFNKLTRVSGISHLKQLTDLSLFDNEIINLEGSQLQSLEKLSFLSLGNNRIKDFGQLDLEGFRKLKSLKALVLKGNPLCGLEEYPLKVLAFLTNLSHLDYFLIEKQDFLRARDAKLDQVLLLETAEKQEEALRKEKKAKENHRKLLIEANLEDFGKFFQDMQRNDPEFSKLKRLPGFDTIQNQHRTVFATISEDLATEILKKHSQKEVELKSLNNLLKKLETKSEILSIAQIDKYSALKKKSLRSYSLSLERGMPNSEFLNVLRESLSKTIFRLMEIELFLVEEQESVLDQFEKSANRILGENVQKISTSFKALMENLQKKQNALFFLANQLLESFAKDDTLQSLSLPKDFLGSASKEAMKERSKDAENDGGESERFNASSTNFSLASLKALLSDKEMLTTAISNSYENHENKLTLKEDEIREREESSTKKTLKNYRETSKKRNRLRIAEIHELKAREEADIEKAEQEQEHDMDDPRQRPGNRNAESDD